MRVILLVTDLERGGTPLRIARTAIELQACGIEAHVGCLAPRGPVNADLERAGVPTFACDARHARDTSAIARLVRRIRAIRPNLVHASLTHANVAARIARLATHVPVLTSTVTLEVERRWHRFAEMLTAPLDQGHVVSSRTLAEHVRRAFLVPRKKIHLVPPAVDVPAVPPVRAASRAALGIPAHEFVVLWAGRFDPVKRIDAIVRCAEIMSTVPVRFLLAGDGPHRAAIERQIRLTSAARIVHLLGWREDLPQCMAAADAFLFPSRTEGMPNAVLQAMAAGLPVVAAEIPPLRELAGDEERLVLVDGAEPRKLADALHQLRNDEARRRAIARASRQWALEHLGWPATIRALLRLYEILRRGK